MKKIINNKKLIVGLIFIIYLLMLCYHLFLSDSIGKREISESYRYNFILFKEILRYVGNIDVIGAKLVFINIIGNVVAFAPFGIFVGYFLKNSKYTFLKERYKKYLKYSLILFLSSLFIFLIVTSLNDSNNQTLKLISTVTFYLLTASGVESILLYVLSKILK